MGVIILLTSLVVVSVVAQIIVARFFTETQKNTKVKCKYIKREGESCTLNNNCKYPSCQENKIKNLYL